MARLRARTTDGRDGPGLHRDRTRRRFYRPPGFTGFTRSRRTARFLTAPLSTL